MTLLKVSLMPVPLHCLCTLVNLMILGLVRFLLDSIVEFCCSLPDFTFGLSFLVHL